MPEHTTTESHRHRLDEARSLFREYAALVREHFGERVAAVWLYGSAARGDWTDESDIDVLVPCDEPLIEIPSPDENEVTRQIAEYVAALVDESGIIWAEGFGHADKARQIPAAAETVYRAGSLAKLLTATAILQLEDRARSDAAEASRIRLSVSEAVAAISSKRANSTRSDTMISTTDRNRTAREGRSVARVCLYSSSRMLSQPVTMARRHWLTAT